MASPQAVSCEPAFAPSSRIFLSLFAYMLPSNSLLDQILGSLSGVEDGPTAKYLPMLWRTVVPPSSGSKRFLFTKSFQLHLKFAETGTSQRCSLQGLRDETRPSHGAEYNTSVRTSQRTVYISTSNW